MVPKLESFLNQSNRIPSACDFDDDFELHFERLVDTLQGILSEQAEMDEESSFSRTESSSGNDVLTLSSDDDAKKSKEERAVESEMEKKDQLLQLLQAFRLERSDSKIASLLGDLKFLCRNEECGAFAIKARAISMLMKHAMLPERPPEVQLQAICVLRNLTGIPDDGVITGYKASSAARNSDTKQTAKLIILEADFLPRLVEILGSTGNAALASQISIVIGNVVDIFWVERGEQGRGWGKFGHGITREAVLESEPEAALVRALSLGDGPAMAACYAMKNICYDSPNSVRQGFTRHNLKEALRALIVDHDKPEPIEMAIWLMKRLSWCAESGHGDNQMALNFTPLLPEILAAAQANISEEITLQAFDALHTMSFGTGENVAMAMVEAGAVPILLQCCVSDHRSAETPHHVLDSSHWSCGGLGERTRVCAALTLDHISLFPKCAAALVEAGTVPMLCGLLQSGPLLRTKRWPGGEHVSATLLNIAGYSTLVGALCKELSAETTADAVQAIKELAAEDRDDVNVLYAW